MAEDSIHCATSNPNNAKPAMTNSNDLDVQFTPLSDTAALGCPGKAIIASWTNGIEHKYSVYLSTPRRFARDVSWKDKTIRVHDTVPVCAILLSTDELRILEPNLPTKIDKTVLIAHDKIVNIDGFFHTNRRTTGDMDP